MSERAHTKGPWKVDGSTNDWTAEPYEFEGGSAAWQPISADGRDDPVCLVVQQGGFRFDEAELDANACLIAAAPDMFEALLQARDWLEGWVSAEPQLAIIEAALAKASPAPTKGEASDVG